jgi:hypothetical protein
MMNTSGYETGHSGDAAAGHNPTSAQVADHEGMQSPSPGLATLLVSAACLMCGVVRDTVFVTLDALRGRYDH